MAEIKYPNKQAAAIITAQRRSEEALLAYLQNPSICAHCKTPILPKGKEKPGVARRKKFCSHACAGSFNNRKYPKRQPEGACEECGAPTNTRNTWCSSLCKGRTMNRRLVERAKTKGQYKGKYVVYSRQRRKKKAVEYKGGQCIVCGYSRSVRAMKFHHLDPSQKDFGISTSGNTMSWEKMRVELDKCILVCGNCHDEIHDGLVDVSAMHEHKITVVAGTPNP